MHGTNTLVIYIDGSAITNPGPTVGCAGIVEYPEYCDKNNENIGWSYDIGTNQSMELLALNNALKWVNKNQKKLKDYTVNRIVIISDSMYVIDGAKTGVFIWKDNGWKKKDGGTLTHEDLWKEYIRERRKMCFGFDIVWKKGKSNELAKEVDGLAKTEAEKLPQKKNYSHVVGKIGRPLTGKKFKLELFHACDQTILMRVCLHRLVNQRKDSEYEVQFEEIDDKYFVIGRFKARTSKEIDNKFIDRGHFYKATFNKDENHPWIESVKEISGKKLDALKKEVKKNLGKE